MTSTFPFALVSVVGTLGYLVVFVALHLLPTGYDPIRHAVSDYAVGRYRRWFTVGLWSSSVSVLALAAGLGMTVGSPPLADRDLVFLGLIAVTRLGMSVYSTTLEGERLTRAGAAHYLFAILAFTFTYLAISQLNSPLSAITPWHSASVPLGWLAWLIGPALGAVVVTMIRPLRRFFGLFERIFLVSTNVWFLIVATMLLTKSG